MKKVGGFVLFNLGILFILFFCLNSFFLVSAGELKVTLEHPFLIDGEWISASQLKVGDVLQTVDGKNVTIKSIKSVSEENNFSVYNLEAGEYHNFVVCGEENCSADSLGVVVHNSNGFIFDYSHSLSPHEPVRNSLLLKMSQTHANLISAQTNDRLYVLLNTVPLRTSEQIINDPFIVKLLQSLGIGTQGKQRLEEFFDYLTIQRGGFKIFPIRVAFDDSSVWTQGIGGKFFSTGDFDNHLMAVGTLGGNPLKKLETVLHEGIHGYQYAPLRTHPPGIMNPNFFIPAFSGRVPQFRFEGDVAFLGTIKIGQFKDISDGAKMEFVASINAKLYRDFLVKDNYPMLRFGSQEYLNFFRYYQIPKSYRDISYARLYAHHSWGTPPPNIVSWAIQPELNSLDAEISHYYHNLEQASLSGSDPL